jgi:GTP-binding protein
MSRALRNIAIIAHVDHGKTTLVDQLLRQSGTFAAHQQLSERVMDSNDLEKERGITILAKNTSVNYNDVHINIVDTPGHADFGGEVERVLGMVDGVLLLVDAVEGPMPQTRFVTKKALALGLRPIVVVNKVDRDGADADNAVNLTFDLFDKLGASDEQMDFPIVYASGLNGWAAMEMDEPRVDMKPLFETVLKHVPPPATDEDAPLQLQISALDYNSYVGRIGVGRIQRGRVKTGQQVVVLFGTDEEMAEHERVPVKAKIGQVLGYQGLNKVELDEGLAGDIVQITGIEDLVLGATITDPVDEPTLTMNFMVNTSPLAGTEGKFVTSRQIRERLTRNCSPTSPCA